MNRIPFKNKRHIVGTVGSHQEGRNLIEVDFLGKKGQGCGTRLIKETLVPAWKLFTILEENRVTTFQGRIKSRESFRTSSIARLGENGKNSARRARDTAGEKSIFYITEGFVTTNKTAGIASRPTDPVLIVVFIFSITISRAIELFYGPWVSTTEEQCKSNTI